MMDVTLKSLAVSNSSENEREQRNEAVTTSPPIDSDCGLCEYTIK
jgi:hypothetical protein